MYSFKPVETRLEHLPPDLWAYIAPYIEFIPLRRLKMTGSKQLWQRLTAKGVVKSVIFERDSHFLNRNPTFLNELPSIDELVYDNSSGTWNQEWKPQLSDVPKTLKKLTILGGSSSFFADDHFVLTDHVPLLEYLDVNRSWERDDDWTKHIPSNLTFLKVQEWDGSALPATLLEFETYSLSLEDILGTIPALPPQLESFTADVLYGDDIEVALPLILPSSIRALSVGQWDHSFVDDKFEFAQLPSLTKLSKVDFPSDIYKDSRLQSKPDSLLRLPSCLTQLEVGHLPLICWQYLPSTLKILNLDDILSTDSSVNDTIKKSTSSGAVHHIKRYPIHQLPKAITTLTMSFDTNVFLDTDDIIGVSTLFPPQLTDLNLICAQTSVSVAKQLPSTLTSLEVSNLDYTICEHLPRGLTELYADNVILNSKLVKRLPQTLIYLTLFCIRVDGACIDPETGQSTTFEALQSKYSRNLDFGLINHKPPKNARTATKKGGRKSSKGASTFPNSSEEILMQLWQGDACLPPGLEILEIISRDLTDSFFEQNLQALECLNLNNSPLLTDAVIPRLPRGLKSLDLSLSTEITGKCFRELPRTLQKLKLTSSTEIFDEDIQHLPRTLKSLKIESAGQLTHLGLEHMPKSLEKLKLNYKIQVVPHWLAVACPGYRTYQSMSHGPQTWISKAYNSIIAFFIIRFCQIYFFLIQMRF